MQVEEIQSQEIVTISPFEKTKEEIIAFVDGYKNLVVTEATYEEAKKARAALRDVRYGIESTEKGNTKKLNELKDKNWSQGKELVDLIIPTENTVDAGIKVIENRKAAIKAEKERLEREKVEAEIRAEQERLAQVEKDRIAAIEAAQKAEGERLAQLQAEIDERNRVEQERLNKIKAEQEKQQAAILADQQRIAKEQAEREAKIKAEQEGIDRIKRELEEERQREANEKIRLAELEVAREEAAARAIVEAEAKVKREVEEKIEAERKAAEELARQEALKPDIEKIRDLITSLSLTSLPTVNDDKAKAVISKVEVKIAELMDFIALELKNL